MDIVKDGSFTMYSQPAVPVNSRGLMYGEGCFETFRSYEGRTFLLEEHLERLQAGLRFLGMSMPADLEKNRLKKQLRELLERNGLLQKDAVVRLQVWREGERGYRVRNGGEPHYVITAFECPDRFSPLRLVTVDTRRIPSESLPSDFKFTNGINYILAAREAERQGGDDALMQTTDGWISETTMANIFWLKERTVYTPSATCDVLPGITRNIVMRLIGESGTAVKEGEYLLEHLNEAAAVWICNSVREVLPVQRVNDLQFDIGHSFLVELNENFRNYRNHHLEELII